MNFLKRIRYHASLPENANARFHIPVNLMQYDHFLLNDNQIDSYIRLNGLIVFQQVEPQLDQKDMGNIGDTDESLDSMSTTSETTNSTTGNEIQRSGREIQFKVPAEYLDTTNV